MERKQGADRNLGRALVLATALCWGLAGVCIKSVSWGAMPLVCARNFCSLVILLIARKSLRIPLTLPNICCAVCISVTGMLYLAAIKLTTAGTAIVLQYVAPILVFVYALVFQHRKAKLAEILVTGAVFLGIVLSFADGIFAQESNPTALLGDTLALASGVSYAAEIILLNRENIDSQGALILANCLSFCIGLPFLLTDPSVTFTAKNLFWVAILGIFQYGAANLLFSIGVKKVEPIEASLILTIEPIFNPIPVALLNGEKMGPLALIGAAIVIIFVTLYGLLPTIEAKRKARRSAEDS